MLCSLHNSTRIGLGISIRIGSSTGRLRSRLFRGLCHARNCRHANQSIDCVLYVGRLESKTVARYGWRINKLYTGRVNPEVREVDRCVLQSRPYTRNRVLSQEHALLFKHNTHILWKFVVVTAYYNVAVLWRVESFDDRHHPCRFV